MQVDHGSDSNKGAHRFGFDERDQRQVRAVRFGSLRASS